jgi:hypothetical protein
MAIARLPILLLALGLWLWLGGAAQQSSDQAPIRSTLRVTGGDWADTNVEVAAGDRLRLIARPVAGERDPDVGGRSILMYAVAASSDGRIDEQRPFRLGVNWITARASGRLQVRFRMAALVGAERPSQFDVTIERIPGTPPDRDDDSGPTNNIAAPQNNVAAPQNNLADDVPNGAVANNAAGNTEAANTEAANDATANGAVMNHRVGDNVAHGNGTGTDGAAAGWRWLIVLLLELGAAALVLWAIVEAKRWLDRRARRDLHPEPAAAPPPRVTVRPSLELGDGEMSGDEIALAGPAVRLRAALEPGGSFFDGDGPRIEREEGNG